LQFSVHVFKIIIGIAKKTNNAIQRRLKKFTYREIGFKIPEIYHIVFNVFGWYLPDPIF